MIIYDIDKVIRETIEVRHNGKVYEAKEPTVQVWGEINSMDLEKGFQTDFIGTGIKIIEKIIPDIENLNNLTDAQFKTLLNVCLTIISGGAGKGKPKAPQEIMTRV